MGLFRRRREVPVETRDVTAVPWDVGGFSASVVTQDTALTLGPVYAAARHLADGVASLPLQGFRRQGQTREPMKSLPLLFRLLQDDGELNDWEFVAVTSLALRGNAVGLISGRDKLGFPAVITWVPMDDIFVDDQMFPRAVWYYKGRQVRRDALVHIPWFKVAGRTLGLSPIEAYALTVTSGLEAQKFGTDWFQAGGVPPGTFKNSAKTVDKTEADMIKARLVSAIRTHKPIVYGSDWDYNAISIPPEQAQFIETMKLSANQIAAIYGIAPEEIGGEAANGLTYSNEEHRETRRMADLRPWLVRLETKYESWLPERQYVRHNANAVIRADLMTRHQVYKLDRDMGFASIDELRAREDLPPLPNGAGQDYTPLSTKQGAAPPTQPALPAPVRELIPGEPLVQPRSNGHRTVPALVE